MKKALDIVQNLDDVQAVMMLKYIYQDIFRAVPFEEVKQNVQDRETISQIDKLSTDVMKQSIDAEQSVELTRNMLLCFAKDENLSNLVTDAWERVYNDDSLIIETIITVGLIANLTLFMATTEVEFEFKGIKIKKMSASGEQIKAVLNPLTELIKKIVPGFA